MVQAQANVVMIPLDQIDADPQFNARIRIDPKDPKVIGLASSLESKGQLENLVIRVKEEATKASSIKYALVAGFRRYTAMTQILHWKEARCLVKVESELEAVVTNLVENLEREQLRPIEIAERCLVLKTLGMDVPKIAKQLNFTPSHVYQLLRVAKLHPKILEDLHRASYGETMTQLITFASLESDEQLNAWNMFLGAKEEKAAGNGSSAKEKSDAEPKKKIPRVLHREKIQKLLEVDLGRADNLDAEQRKFAKRILLWVLGQTPNYPVRLPPEEIEE